MKLFDVLGGTAKVFLRTRDEHCPPHVHIGHKGEGWEARIQFSYVDDVVSVMEIYPARGKPGIATLNAVLAEIQAALAICRCKWLMVVPDMDLNNKWVQITGANRKGKLLTRKAKGAVQVRTASYDAETRVVTLRMRDGSEHEMVAGTGVVE